MRDINLTKKGRFVNLHPNRGSLKKLYLSEFNFDSLGCGPPILLSIFINKTIGKCVFTEQRIPGNNSYCAPYCLYIFYQNKLLKTDIKSAVLHLFYRIKVTSENGN